VAQGAASREPEESARLFQLVDEVRALDLADAAVRKAIDTTLACLARSLNTMLDGDQMTLREALPAAVRDQFVSADGHYLVMLHPKDDVWEYEPMRMFIEDVRAVDPNVTGTPITHLMSLGEMLRAFIIMSVLALAAIIVLLAIDFHSARDVILALAPLIVGLIWTVEVMGLFGLSFNLANFFAAPMLIGLGVDSAVHILHRYHEGGDRLNMGHTRRAVILTALTTIIGFGALVIAHHRGLRSLGLVMAIGSTACMLSSIIVLPALLAWREQRRKAAEDSAHA
jgi:predicted RND superfamily exporter protein